MDLQRSRLIGAIAVLGFMLLTEWVAFTDEKQGVKAQETTRILNNDGAATSDVPMAPELTTAVNSDDIPSAPTMEQDGQDLPASSNGNIIQGFIFEAEALGGALRWEPSRGGALFPHLYGPLRMADVAWAEPLPLADGRHVFPNQIK